jgi:hypothetical protein
MQMKCFIAKLDGATCCIERGFGKRRAIGGEGDRVPSLYTARFGADRGLLCDLKGASRNLETALAMSKVPQRCIKKAQSPFELRLRHGDTTSGLFHA